MALVQGGVGAGGMIQLIDLFQGEQRAVNYHCPFFILKFTV
jgi:hypothetical protein